ncbi:MAG TPA: DNA polymerase I, partial [Betaproteobacteria bacterium]|nr:DNA polymerase I [Betaproteobacteria bacterium]
MKTLLLVDGSSYLYRAFHALPDLRNRNNEPTGAIYGVINMLRRLTKDIRADYSACVFDAKGKTFRDAWYPAYKAHRPPMPEGLAAQTEPLHRTIRALGWPLLMIDGVEADDVIGTLAEQAGRQGVQTIVSTGDKDMAQLVNPHVRLVNTMTNEQLDAAGVVAKFGVPPERIVDYLALIGDSADNIPGVTKVGPKTAVKWLHQYQTLENLIAHDGEIGGAAGENLRQARDWLPQAQRLLTIKCDVPLPLAVAELTSAPPDNAKLAELFEHFEFNSWRRELNGAQAENAPENPHPPRHYETIATPAQLAVWLERIEQAALTALDTETTSLDPMNAQLVGLSFAVSAHHAAYLPLAHRYPGAPAQLEMAAVLARLKPWLENPARRKLGQNLKYDMHVLANHGVALRGMA